MPRYIDADALLKAVNSSMESGTLYLPIEFCDLIENAPTADAVERKKGVWIQGFDVRCSNCNYKLQTTGLPSRCPNCYAEMEQI